MIRYIVDTNVPIVANGKPLPPEERPASIDCRIAAVNFLQQVLNNGKILIDLAGEIQAEYRRYLNASGQPGVGDRFYQEVLNSAPNRIERIELPVRDDGEFEDIPQALITANFDPSDRKFAALAKKETVPVSNATDSDWINHATLLQNNGIQIIFVCGCDVSKWFAE